MDRCGYTPTMFACRYGQADVVRYLHIKVGSDFSAKNHIGETAAVFACRCGHADVVRYLNVNAGADFRAKNQDGYTAAMWAARQHQDEGCCVPAVEQLGLRLIS